MLHQPLFVCWPVLWLLGINKVAIIIITVMQIITTTIIIIKTLVIINDSVKTIMQFLLWPPVPQWTFWDQTCSFKAEVTTRHECHETQPFRLTAPQPITGRARLTFWTTRRGEGQSEGRIWEEPVCWQEACEAESLQLLLLLLLLLQPDKRRISLSRSAARRCAD